jgi:hypothetical protein
VSKRTPEKFRVNRKTRADIPKIEIDGDFKEAGS